MKKILFILAFLVIGYYAQSQTVPRIPLYEVFTSSTCPPCYSANEYLTPIFEQYKDQIAIIKYQMNWPGTGDPYFTDEGGRRRATYGVTGVPSVFHNGINQSYSLVDADSITNELNEMTAKMKMEVRYMIDEESHTIRIKAYYEALEDLTNDEHYVYIPIVERKTTGNIKTNGETEFHDVLKKMLPNSNGEMILGEIDKGDSDEFDITYEFKGSYRLPSDATDEIDHDIEHSVEEFSDLHVIMFAQDRKTKEIYQAAVGEQVTTVQNLERAWESTAISVDEIPTAKSISIFPNPSNNWLNIVAENQVINSVVVLAMDGSTFNLQVSSYNDRAVVDVSKLSAGMYFIKVNNGTEILSEKISIIR